MALSNISNNENSCPGAQRLKNRRCEVGKDLGELNFLPIILLFQANVSVGCESSNLNFYL